MFGRKEPKKKVHTIKYILLLEGLPNFKSDSVIEVVVDETDRLLTFKAIEGVTATLTFDKIIRYEEGVRLNVIQKSLLKSDTVKLKTLRIVYRSNDEEKSILLSETNYGGAVYINSLKAYLYNNIKVDAPAHIEL